MSHLCRGRRASGAVAVMLAAMTVAGCSSAPVDSSPSAADDETVRIGLVTRTDSNPFFVKLREEAQASAAGQGAQIIALTGQTHDDAAGQVTAIENLVAQGVDGILVTPSDAEALNSAITTAREAGVVVVALDGRVDPDDTVDVTIATDNREAGRLQGAWAQGALGDETARVALVDGTRGTVSTRERHDGFLRGFGLEEGADEIVAQENISDQAEAQTALENFFQRDPSINVVYTVYEPASIAAADTVERLGIADQVVIGSIDGSCDGVEAVADGRVGATVMQFPGRMAELGVQAIVDAVRDGTRASGYIDSGSVLITDQPVAGVESEDSQWGLANCW